MNGGRIRVVLVRPRHAGNVGAAARAMKNTGLDDLVVVAAQPLDLESAAVMAVHAADVLARHRRVPTLADAIGDCGLVVGTVGREGGDDLEAAAPRALAPAILDAARTNEVALVFGPEDHGLSNDELMRCHRRLTIPTATAYGSLNLAQAVLVCGYELLLARPTTTCGGDAPADAEVAATDAAMLPYARRGLAPAAAGDRMYAALERALREIGFLHRDNGVHMMRVFRRVLGRAALDAYETRVFLGLARQLAWAARKLRGRVHDENAAALTKKSHAGS
jgi:TrmH family RNA methyltransferase